MFSARSALSANRNETKLREHYKIKFVEHFNHILSITYFEKCNKIIYNYFSISRSFTTGIIS
jgi:hypothetical protein